VSKKPKKAKTPKAPKGRGGPKTNKPTKDTITGLDLGNGLILKSDTVYSDQSPEYKALFGRRDSVYSAGGETQIEFEFSNNAIAHTSVTTGEYLQNGQRQYAPDYKSRAILIGKFKSDKNGLLALGEIIEASEWTYTPDRAATAEAGASLAEESIITFQSPTTFTKALINSNPDSIFYAFVGGQPVFWYDSHDSKQPELASEFDPKSDFARFESSKYIKDGWWQDPFTPNLI
jgi:hypothetical protein